MISVVISCTIAFVSFSEVRCVIYSKVEKLIPNAPFLFQLFYLIMLDIPFMMLINTDTPIIMDFGETREVSFSSTNIMYYGKRNEKNSWGLMSK